MEQRKLSNTCSFAGVKPVMMDLPYPEIQVERPDCAYAQLLGIDYCGAVSEMSAITQYINNENRLSCEKCAVAQTLLGMAMAEMMHMQKLGELIWLLGGRVDFAAKTPNGNFKLWTPEYITIPENPCKMLEADIEAEKAAIAQYEMHINMINDNCVRAVLRRIIKDEEYHIMILKALMASGN